MPEPKAREQFVRDFLLVAENDSEIYLELKKAVEEKGTPVAAGNLQYGFEKWISELSEQEKEKGNEFGSLLIRQLLIGWGADAFYQIAKRFEEMNQEESEFLDKINAQEKRRFDYLGSLPEEI